MPVRWEVRKTTCPKQGLKLASAYFIPTTINVTWKCEVCLQFYAHSDKCLRGNAKDTS